MGHVWNKVVEQREEILGKGENKLNKNNVMGNFWNEKIKRKVHYYNDNKYRDAGDVNTIMLKSILIKLPIPFLVHTTVQLFILFDYKRSLLILWLCKSLDFESNM